MTIVKFRAPDKKNRIVPDDHKNRRIFDRQLTDQQLDDLLRSEYLENALELEETAKHMDIGVSPEQQEADAIAGLDQMLKRVQEDEELRALMNRPVGNASSTNGSIDEDTEELLLLGRALKESGKTLEDVLGKEEKKRPRFGKKTKAFVGIAASLVLVLTVSMSSEAMKTFLIERLGWTMGENPATTIDTESELHFSEEREFSEAEALEVIKNDLGIYSLFFSERPEGMIYEGVHVEPEMQWAKMFYTYRDMIVTVIMDKSDEDMSMSVVYDGEKIEEWFIELPEYAIEVKVEKIQRDKEHTAFYAELEYGNAFYTIRGDMEEDVFLDLIRNIIFG